MDTMDGVIDTVSDFHSIMPVIGLLKSHGKLVMVGAPNKPLELPVLQLLGQYIKTSSLISFFARFMLALVSQS